MSYLLIILPINSPPEIFVEGVFRYFPFVKMSLRNTLQSLLQNGLSAALLCFMCGVLLLETLVWWSLRLAPLINGYMYFQKCRKYLQCARVLCIFVIAVVTASKSL